MESHLKSQKKALKSFCVFAVFVSVNLTQRNTLETDFVFLYLNVLAFFPVFLKVKGHWSSVCRVAVPPGVKP